MVAEGKPHKRLRLQQERAVVADVVDDLQDLVVRGLAQAAAELLQPDDPRLGGAEHQHRVQLREVEPLVEDVHGTDDVQLAGREQLEGLRTRGGRLAGMGGVSAWRWETQNAIVRVPPRLPSWSSALAARVSTARRAVRAFSSNRAFRHGMFV